MITVAIGGPILNRVMLYLIVLYIYNSLLTAIIYKQVFNWTQEY